MSPKELLGVLNDVDIWLNKLKPRWMDLVGDYAGDEFFVVDGDSLCQKVLDDELVAIGRPGDSPSFQILHGIYCLEQAILDLKRRDCNFEIVFFECNKHGTILTGASDFVTSSRLLAREIMISHIMQMTRAGKFGSARFQNLEDAGWQKYVKDKRPMFVLYHTGPTIDAVSGDDKCALSRVLLQRTFIRDLLLSRLAVSTLNQIRFVDSKILSFVYERQRAGDTQRGMPKQWSEAVGGAVDICEDKLKTSLLELGHLDPTPRENHNSWLITAAKNLLNSSESSLDAALTFLFAGSQLSLSSLSLQQRAQYLCHIDSNLREYLVSEFYPRIFQYLGLHLGDIMFFPDLDGNIFLSFLNCALKAPQSTLEELLGPSLAGNITVLWASTGLSLPNLKTLASRFSYTPILDRLSLRSHSEPEFRLHQFSHPVFDKYLPSIAVNSPSEPGKRSTRIQKLCDESVVDEKHPHTSKSLISKSLGGKDYVATSERQRIKHLRWEQRFMANLQRHAQTLTGVKGQPIQRIVITEVSVSTPSGSSSARRNKVISSYPTHAPPNKSGKGSKSKVPQLTSAQKLKAKIEAEKHSKKSSEDDIWWKPKLKEIEATSDIKGRLDKVNLLLRGKRAENGWLAVEVSLYQLHLTILAWLADEQGEAESACEEYIVRILRSIHQLREHPSLFPAASHILAQVLMALGFDSITPPTAKVQEERELSFKFVKLMKSKSGKPLHPQLRIRVSPSEFLLKAYGAYMDRSMDSKPDHRVGFEPDGWQRQVLDKIDNNESVLVVAPTSAGKTFSSFYAMEKVLRESNDGVVVYVSPTKALCQQIAADVYARFSKNMPGRTVWAIHTRDFRIHDPMKAQILVTVPEILSIMLLSSSMAKVWVPRLKYIILDEIHSIGQMEEGQVWEHIILLSNCPILGLSANIGEPEVFSDWLGSVQKAHEQPYSMVEHKHRYSHLRKYVWQPLEPSQPQYFRGLHSPVASDSQLRALHPMSALLLGGNSIPPDLALESRDCLNLYLMMATCVAPRELDHLHPKAFFSDKQHDFLKQSDVIRYEEALKNVVNQWAKAQDSDMPQSPYQKLLVALRVGIYHDGPIEHIEDACSDDDATNGLIHLLHKLNSDGDLPCLAFNFDRSGCERFAKVLLRTLQEGERTWRESSPQWMEKLEQWEAWKLAAKSRQREAERASRRNPEDPQEVSSSISWQSQFDPNDPSPEFSFANAKAGYSKEELRKDIAIAARQSNPWPEYLVLALQRGIAVHHAGMPRGYRSLVESLFRLGYCRIVISTGTLALGINAPAKSVIFLGDSPFLTALMYRQCAGRAGRRGYDLLGKVIFFNLPLDRIHRLILSRIPPLTGNWPLTTTLCLRLFNLLTGSDHAPSAVSAIDSLMRLPRLSLSSERMRLEVLHHMRFSIEYLRRQRLLLDNGYTTALFGIVGHLYYEEPGNLAFAALVREGTIHKLCSTFRTNQRETERNIIHLVATLFARRPLPHFVASRKVLESLRKSLPSIIKLPPLPAYICEVLARFNRESLQVFTAYASTYAKQHLEKISDDILPLSMHQPDQKSGLISGLVLETLTETRLKECVARSLFVSNSGADNTFGSAAQLCRSARSGLHLDEQNVPNLNFMEPINAYAYDFWQHESVRPLIEANGLRNGDVWFALQNFSMVLATLLTNLRKLLIDQVTAEVKHTEAAESHSEDTDEETDEFEAKIEAEDEGDSFEQIEMTTRPTGVPEEDWMVYEAFQSVAIGFNEKWYKMWA